MGDFTTWFMSLVTPVVRKVLTSLGIGWLSFEGITSLLNQVRDSVLAKWSESAPVVYDLLSLAGFTDALGIILGAVGVIAGLAVLGKLGKVVA